ncbi:MAG TPA: hypothetical protein IAA69_01040 [Candidatus Aveggerthella stercoripullorum]|uniref:NACHT domain-containing protein n=1 Tax=Candidatus Aveggerthella stercoripullorum TaxID=2840688 RepID=A0A9D0ZYA5_9ACTN|nr:hypothetical protein [Candidatus Aveggerthella stercoripullorum]
MTERTKGISGEEGSSCKYHPDEIVRTYFYYGPNAGQRLSRSPNAEHFELLCKDRKTAHEAFAQLAIQDEEWRQGVLRFASKVLSVWKDERAELLSRAYSGTTLRHILMQYVAIDENIAPIVMFKQAVWIIGNNKSADKAEVALGLYDAIERLFYELGARPIVYTRQMLFEDDAFGEFGKARNHMARDPQFSEGQKLTYLYSYDIPLDKTCRSEDFPDEGFIAQFQTRTTTTTYAPLEGDERQKQNVNGRNEAMDLYFRTAAMWKDSILERRIDPNAIHGGNQNEPINQGYVDRYVPLSFLRDDEEIDVFSSFLLDDSKARLLVLTDSGSGKTTFLRGLVALIAQLNETSTDDTADNDRNLAKALDPELTDSDLNVLRSYVPIMLAQPPYSQTENHEGEYGALDAPNNPELFAKTSFGLLPQGYSEPYGGDFNSFLSIIEAANNPLLLVDSIDEVPSNHRHSYIRQLECFVAEYGIRKVIVTSRPLGARETQQLKGFVLGNEPVTIAPLSIEEQNKLAGKVAQNVSLKELACFVGSDSFLTNPLLLTSMARYRGNGGSSISEALSQASQMLVSLGGDFYSESVNDEISRLAFSLSTSGSGIAQRDFEMRIRGSIKDAAQLSESEYSSRVQSVLWRRGLFKIEQAESASNPDKVEFRYEALRSYWAALYLWKTLDTEWVAFEESGYSFNRSDEDPFYPSRTLGLIGRLLTGKRNSSYSALTILLFMDLLCAKPFVTGVPIEILDYVTSCINERVFIGYRYPNRSESERETCRNILQGAETISFNKPLGEALTISEIELNH